MHLSLNLNPFCKMNPLGFLYPIHQLLTEKRKVLWNLPFSILDSNCVIFLFLLAIYKRRWYNESAEPDEQLKVQAISLQFLTFLCSRINLYTYGSFGGDRYLPFLRLGLDRRVFLLFFGGKGKCFIDTPYLR